MNKIETCPICKASLEEIDDMNYSTYICPECYSAIFEEPNGNVHAVKYGIAEDGYNVSLDIFYKQILMDRMLLNGMLGMVNPSLVLLLRLVNAGIYNQKIYRHFLPMTDDFKARRPYIYFIGYEKYFAMSDKYAKETFPRIFQ